MGFLGVVQLLESVGMGTGIGWLADPKYWVYPLQTLLCIGALLWYGKAYQFGRPGWLWVLGAGLAALGIWIAPQVVLGAAPRLEGFDPAAAGAGFEIPSLVARMVRLVLVVPLVEEIFWRGFLMRYLVRENFDSVKFGTFTPLSFFGVAAVFMLVHQPVDWPAAFLTGILYGLVAVKTGSLISCVLAHAVTNLGLGIYIVMTRQWGFW